MYVQLSTYRRYKSKRANVYKFIVTTKQVVGASGASCRRGCVPDATENKENKEKRKILIVHV